MKKFPTTNEIMRLNKYLAHAGLCSRRKAVDHIKAGEVKVNGKVEINPAYEVQVTDKITFKGENQKISKSKVYILLNKPKNTVTTVKDERGRPTVMELIAKKTSERVYPIGRLDRNTVGLLLITNDGDLAKKLSHPSSQIKKVYHVVLDKPITQSDIQKIKNGLELEDGKAEIDGLDYIIGKGPNEVGIELHSGKNRIIRRIFAQMGYDVVKLDRTYYAGLTKKDLPRGWSRFLTKKEVIMLKHFT
jgi:23S rRNA pseudouridine2605 synthase